ncbi:hypothetical protein PN419_00295 [Halorubrum ezzemoulense]|uniref:hypothetical protein n=1 Tax=Halorubrum ezzemoulense TaxID=337243 RepID=UPI00233144D7|nr:hypothetical protein [Halorubrum ezzemoulense]MDB9247446.1 hypothetical protein [Halorubrum ezzemoulense]MDB9258645.1 hypothetical protein [Halorubrum ezzemoulense]MDB9264497.1 hypothetical protein [Halorubrum ezzemoulense]MDB9269006.1 hypothetical protein [Halorubrum ezzemoulense]MDB9271465.1 hypothetical protein [Halorubrum ezzemoulense]
MVSIDDIIYEANRNDREVSLSQVSTVEPTLVGPEGTEVTPVFTERLRGTSTNDTVVHKSLCGQTAVEGVGEDEWRVTIEGIVLKRQFDKLVDMRPADNEIKVIGEAATHTGVTFDRFTYEQNDELNEGSFTYQGREVTEPLFEFQLQTQDDSNL